MNSFCFCFPSIIYVEVLVLWSLVRVAGSTTNIFDGILHQVPDNCHFPLLAESKNPADCLMLHGWVPLRLKNMDAIRHRQAIQTEIVSRSAAVSDHGRSLPGTSRAKCHDQNSIL